MLHRNVTWQIKMCLTSKAPSTSYSINFITQSVSSFRSTRPYHGNLFCCGTEIITSNPSLSQFFTWNPSFSLMPHIRLTILISAAEVPSHFLFLQARSHFHVTYHSTHNCCTISPCTNCLNLFHPIRILVSTVEML